MGVALTSELIEAFAGTFLSDKYDGSAPTPQFHRDSWELYCGNDQYAMVIAPRNHAKSTALTFVYVLACVLFRVKSHVIIIGSTEEKGAELAQVVFDSLLYNEDIKREFGITSFPVEQKTEMIVKMSDGHQFRILARGAEQKIRGTTWDGKRPDLIVCDDMEEDDQVINPDRRTKFRRWFFNACIPALSKGGTARVHGTILHRDSLLSRLRNNSTWNHLYYKAHRSFDDFSDLLWPERWSEENLKKVRQSYIDDGNIGGYSQEYLNNPLDSSENFFRPDDFTPMSEEDHAKGKRIIVSTDFAVSKSSKADRTSFTVGGMDTDGVVHIIDQYVGRWSADEFVDILFGVCATYDPELVLVEHGPIWLAIEKMMYDQMSTRNQFFSIESIKSIKDKATRARSMQRRMRAKKVKFDTEAQWYIALMEELINFTGNADNGRDDQVDSMSLLSLGFDRFSAPEEDDFLSDEDLDLIRNDPKATSGQSETTGY